MILKVMQGKYGLDIYEKKKKTGIYWGIYEVPGQ